MDSTEQLILVSDAAYVTNLVRDLIEAALHNGDLVIRRIKRKEYYRYDQMIDHLNLIVAKSVQTYAKEVRHNGL